MTPVSAHFVAAQFDFAGRVAGTAPLGQGLINDTWLVHIDGPTTRRAVLQRINARVFPHPQFIMQNLRVIFEHAAAQSIGGTGLRLPGMYRTLEGADFFLDADGAAWRALHFVEETRTVRVLENTAQAERVGAALGIFHALLNDISPERLQITLPGFHITPHYLARFDATRANHNAPPTDAATAASCEFVEQRRPFARILEDAKARGTLTLRTTHGDPKLDNFLFAESGNDVVSLIDLDTVQAGLIHYDIGDCMRSTCNRAGTSGDDSFDVNFDLATAAALLKGYVAEARAFLTAADYDFLYPAIRLIPFELGLRFLTDHLEGDVYFKTQRPGQNLQRAQLQFRLTEEIERQETSLRALIEALR